MGKVRVESRTGERGPIPECLNVLYFLKKRLMDKYSLKISKSIIPYWSVICQDKGSSSGETVGAMSVWLV